MRRRRFLQFLLGAAAATIIDVPHAATAASPPPPSAQRIVNAPTIRLHAFGWRTTTDAYTEIGSIRADGSCTGILA